MCHLPRKIRTTPESHTPVSRTTIIRVHLNWAVGRGGPKEREARTGGGPKVKRPKGGRAPRGGEPEWGRGPNGGGPTGGGPKSNRCV